MYKAREGSVHNQGLAQLTADLCSDLTHLEQIAVSRGGIHAGAGRTEGHGSPHCTRGIRDRRAEADGVQIEIAVADGVALLAHLLQLFQNGLGVGEGALGVGVGRGFQQMAAQIGLAHISAQHFANGAGVQRAGAAQMAHHAHHVGALFTADTGGHAVHQHALENGYSVVKEIGGHGIGLEFHEDPWVSYTSEENSGVIMEPGMMFTIEPMVNMGSDEVYTDEEDDWTVRTEDGMPSAQWEVTVLVTEDGCEVVCW